MNYLTTTALVLLTLASAASAQRGSRQDAADDVKAFRNAPAPEPGPTVAPPCCGSWAMIAKRADGEVVIGHYRTQEQCLAIKAIGEMPVADKRRKGVRHVGDGLRPLVCENRP